MAWGGGSMWFEIIEIALLFYIIATIIKAGLTLHKRIDALAEVLLEMQNDIRVLAIQDAIRDP